MKNLLPTTPRILLIGSPGAGKGTLSRMLHEELRLPHLSTGDMLRDGAARGTAIGIKAQKIIDQGHFVPDEVVLELIGERLAEADCQAGCIFDGFPRTLAQAEAFARHETQRPNLVLHLNLPDSVVLERICGRWLHEPSGRIYHTTNIPPQIPGRDDITGEPLIQRADDTPETGKKRLAVYYEQTHPLLNYYRGAAAAGAGVNFLEFNANQSPEAVYSTVKTRLGLKEKKTPGPEIEI